MTGKKQEKKKHKTKEKRAPYTKRSLQNTINDRDKQIVNMKKAGSIMQTMHYKVKLNFKSEIRELKRENKKLTKKLEEYEDGK